MVCTRMTDWSLRFSRLQANRALLPSIDVIERTPKATIRDVLINFGGCRPADVDLFLNSIGLRRRSEAENGPEFHYPNFDTFCDALGEVIADLDHLHYQPRSPKSPFLAWKMVASKAAELGALWETESNIPKPPPTGGGTGYPAWRYTTEAPFYSTLAIGLSEERRASLTRLKAIYVAVVVNSANDTEFHLDRTASQEAIRAFGAIIRDQRTADTSGSQLLRSFPPSATSFHQHRQTILAELKRLTDLDDADPELSTYPKDIEDLETVFQSLERLLSTIPPQAKPEDKGSSAGTVGSRQVPGERPAVPKPRGRIPRSLKATHRVRVHKDAIIVRLGTNAADGQEDPGPSQVVGQIYELRRAIGLPEVESQTESDSSVLVDSREFSTPEAAFGLYHYLQEWDRVRGLRNALARLNQELHTSWDYPTPFEIKLLLEYASGSKSLTGGPVLSLKERSIILASAFSGRNIHRISFDGSLPSSCDAAVFDVTTNRWTTQVQMPGDRIRPADEVKEMFVRTMDALEFPVPQIVRNAIARITTAGMTEEIEATKLRRWLNEVNDQHGTRLTLGLVENVLAAALLRLTDDLVEIAHITGDPRLLAHSGIYYYSPSRHHLVDIYSRAVAWIGKRIGNAECNVECLSVDGLIGSALCMHHENLHRIVAKLLSQLHQFNRRTRNTEIIIEYHNHMTAYVGMMLHLGTGIRPVLDPVARWSDMDLVRGYIMISDKDGMIKTSTRIVALAPMLQKQLRNYREHVQRLRARLKSDHLDAISAWNEDPPALFFLTRGLEQHPFSVSAVCNFIHYPGNIPDNYTRHWFRTAARDNGCPGEIVDAAMGHWRMGQHPAGPYATLNHLRAGQTLAKAVEQALIDIGFEIEPGFS